MSMTIQINGSRTEIDFGKILAEPTPRHLAEWGWKLAEAEHELALADTSYRGWRARQGCSLTSGKKTLPSEWKVKQRIEAMPDFATYKKGIADAHFNVRLLTAVVDALKAAL